MAQVFFTANMARHVTCPTGEVDGGTLREVLERVFAGNEPARGYVLDDQAALRKHMTIFINGRAIRDRVHLSDPVPQDGTIYIMQALSGG